MAGNVSGIVLAAGSAKIHDTPKLTLPIDGQPLVRIVASRLLEAGIERVIVVTGAHASAVGDALAGVDVSLVDNPAHASGVGSSIRAGVDAAPLDADALLFMPGDMPLVAVEQIKMLLERFEQSTEGIVVPAFQQVPGYPRILDRKHRDALLALENEADLYHMLADNPHDVHDVHLVTDAVVFDIDDEDDYDVLHRRLGLPNPRAGERAEAR